MKDEDLSQYYTFGFPLLKFMGALAIIGVAVTIVLHYFFG